MSSFQPGRDILTAGEEEIENITHCKSKRGEREERKYYVISTTADRQCVIYGATYMYSVSDNVMHAGDLFLCYC